MDFSSVDLPYDKDTFGKCIRQQREEKGMTVTKLAEAIGISKIYMSDIERGKRPAPGRNKNNEIIDRIISALSIPSEQRGFVIEMAKCTREYLKTVSEYLPESQTGREFIREALAADLTEDDWKDLQQVLQEIINKKRL